MTDGKRFEQNFKKSVPEGVYCLRLIDPAIGFDIKNSKQRFAPQNPYDFILYKNPTLYCLELKSTKAKSISFAGSSPSIKEHQIKALTEASEYCDAGFIFNFRSEEETFYMSIEIFNEIIGNIGKKSLNIKDIRPVSKLIPERKLRVNSRYNLSVLFTSKRGVF